MNKTPSKVAYWIGTFAIALLGFVWGGGVQSTWARSGKLWHKRPTHVQLAPVKVYDLAPLVAKLKPAVFNLRVQGSRPTGGRSNWFFQRRFRRNFKSKGSGFLINAQGYALTNHHVVRYAKNIHAELHDKRILRVKVIGSSPELDVALIRLIPSRRTGRVRFSHVFLGDSSKVRVGEPAIAIGNARGLGFSVTAGIVSAKGRALNGVYENYIQTDAAINHGNSGGPLFNKRGEVIGINTAILRGGRGIGFAVPINIVKRILPQLKKHGRVQRAQLGISIQHITPELVRSFRLKAPVGALVREVIPGSPAAVAGIRVGDVIFSFNGQVVRNHKDLPRMVAFNPPGSLGRIVLLRRGKRVRVRVRLARWGQPVVRHRRARRTRRYRDRRPRFQGRRPQARRRSVGRALRRLGVGIRSLSAQHRRQLGLSETQGVYVSSVQGGSPAGRNGLRRGDVIVEVNRTAVRSTRHFLKLISGVRSGDNVLLLVRRSNSALFLAFPLP